MDLSRRQFLKLGGLTPTMLALGREEQSAPAPLAAKPPAEQKWTKATHTICPWDASGCGFIVYTDAGGKIVQVEGDPEHPINQGAACSKGAAMAQIHDNELRLRKVLYKAPGASQWEEKSWDWALSEVAKRIKKTRDANWIESDSAGTPVRRTEAIASLGGSALDNEECYLLIKALRAMGLVYIEHHARL